MQHHKDYIASVRWQFAKTMPKNPHWYTVRTWNPDKVEQFEALAQAIIDHGYDKKWWSMTYRYFDIDGFTYWFMEDTAKEAVLINRAEIKT